MLTTRAYPWLVIQPYYPPYAGIQDPPLAGLPPVSTSLMIYLNWCILQGVDGKEVIRKRE